MMSTPNELNEGLKIGFSNIWTMFVSSAFRWFIRSWSSCSIVPDKIFVEVCMPGALSSSKTFKSWTSNKRRKQTIKNLYLTQTVNFKLLIKSFWKSLSYSWLKNLCPFLLMSLQTFDPWYSFCEPMLSHKGQLQLTFVPMHKMNPVPFLLGKTDQEIFWSNLFR